MLVFSRSPLRLAGLRHFEPSSLDSEDQSILLGATAVVIRGGSARALKDAAAGKSRRRRDALADAGAAEALTGRLHNRALPELVIEPRDPRSLHAPEHNIKATSNRQIARLGSAIERLDYMHPVLITADGEIIDGVSTVGAAIYLGLMSVPTIVVSHLDAHGVALLRLALNALPQRAEWNVEALRVEVTGLIEAQVSLDFVFDPPDIDLLIGQDQQAPDPKANAQLAVEAATGAAIPPGGLWRLGEHRLIQGDARNPAVYLHLLSSATPRAIMADAPYNVGADVVAGLRSQRQGEFVMGSGEMSNAKFIAFLAEALGAAAGPLVDGGLVFSFMDWRHIHHLIAAAESIELSLINVAVWVKAQGGMGSLYRSQHELCGVFKKGQAAHVNNVGLGRHGRDRCNVWRYPGANTAGSSARAMLGQHPTPKSVELIEDAILDVTHRGDAVLDPFAGSGTTLIAAHRTGRVGYGVELDPRYVEVTLRRWQALTGIPAVLDDTGETYAQVAARSSAEAPSAVPCNPVHIEETTATRPRIRVKAGRVAC